MEVRKNKKNVSLERICRKEKRLIPMVNARQEGRRYISMRIAHMSNPQKEESALAKFRVVVLLFNWTKSRIFFRVTS